MTPEKFKWLHSNTNDCLLFGIWHCDIFTKHFKTNASFFCLFYESHLNSFCIFHPILLLSFSNLTNPVFLSSFLSPLSPLHRTCRCLVLRTTAERWTLSSTSPSPTPTPSPSPSSRPTSSSQTTSAASSPSSVWPRVASRPAAWRCKGSPVGKQEAGSATESC